MVDEKHIDLIERCQQSDSQAQYELYSLYAKGMLNVIYRMVNDVESSHDILQDAFIKIFKQLSSFRGDSTLGAWIKRIVVNTSLNYIKKRGNDLSKITVLSENAATFEEEKDYSSDYQGIDMKDVRLALEKLPEGYRIVFSLYAIEGYDHVEISEILGCSVSNSKSQYNRAKKKLKEIILNNQNVMV